jgi:hypothetical protein
MNYFFAAKTARLFNYHLSKNTLCTSLVKFIGNGNTLFGYGLKMLTLQNFVLSVKKTILRTNKSNNNSWYHLEIPFCLG